MRMRSLLLLVFLVVLAACDETPTATTAPPSSPPPPATVEPVEVRYALDQPLAYEVELRRNVRLSSETGALLDRLPESADVTVTATGQVRLDVVDEGSGGSELVAEVSWDNVVVEGSVDGEPVGEEPRIDGLGHLLGTADDLRVSDSGAADATEAAGRFDLLSDALFGWSGLFGPLLPETPVRAGESWTRTVGGADVEGRVEAASSSRLRLIGTTHVEGRQEDLSDFYAEYVAAFGPTESTPSLRVDFGPRTEIWEATVEDGFLSESQASATAATTATVRGSDGGESTSVVVDVSDELGVEASSRGSETTDPVGSEP